MNQKNVFITLLLAMTVLMGGIVYSDIKSARDKGRVGPDGDNWMWENQWDQSDRKESPEVSPDEAEPDETPGQQITAGNYAEALKLSGDRGVPVLVFYTADWCGWCKKMKSESIPSDKVAEVLKNYVLLYVDTDKDRSGMAKFGVESLPTYVITNAAEDKLKSGSGFMTAQDFSNWLTNPSLYRQPKKESKPQPVDPKERKPLIQSPRERRELPPGC